ncbi:MAG: trypsin-like peptidase domain-containing protein [Pyrinomonadaceae bacterium]
MAKKISCLTLLLVTVLVGSAQTFTAQTIDPLVSETALNSVVTILLAGDGQENAVGSGLIVRSDGYVLAPYNLVRGAREIRVRLRNGETYDKAEIVSTDERRNLTILHINAAGLSFIPNGTNEESQVGSKIIVIANPNGLTSVKDDLMLNSVQMADMIPGAGKGYRLLQFSSIADANASGGLVLDTMGRSLGIVTTTADVGGQNIAVPLTSVLGMIRSAPNRNTAETAISAAFPATTAQKPFPIPQSSVLVPQRGVTPLTAKGPGSVVVKPSTVPEILAASKTIYVTSRTITFKPDQMVNALNSRKEMTDWGLSFVDERELADLILEIDHQLFTYKYTFKLYSQRLGAVVATGSRIIWDGNLGAPYMADRFIEKVKAARGVEKKTPTVKETKVKSGSDKKEDSTH